MTGRDELLDVIDGVRALATINGTDLVSDLVDTLLPLFAAERERVLREAADVLDGADAYDELARPDSCGVAWTEDSVNAAVEASGPIATWLRARAEAEGAGS